MKKRPLFLLIELGLLLVLFAYNAYQTTALHKDYFAEFTLRREKHVAYYLRLGDLLAKENKVEDLKTALDDALTNRYFDFFLMTYKGDPLIWGAPQGTAVDDLMAIDMKKSDPVINEYVSYRSVPVGKDSYLVIGINKPVEAYIEDAFRQHWKLILQDIIVPSILAIWIFAFYIRDILQVLKVFRNQKKRDYKAIKTRSIESEVFVQGLSGYEQTVDALLTQNQTLGNQVLPALKKEILSGKKPPYDFECTMVRTDINNFSSIFHSHDVANFMGVINSFFEDVSHIVSRYNGLVHEFVGDEVIFYFKDEDHGNSFLIALSAIRDINQAASRTHEKTMKEYGYPFTVKSSLSHGKIHFGPLVNGFSLAGSILIETVRILAHIHEKEGNVVYFDQAYLDRVTDLCDIREANRVQLKGFNGERTLYAYRGHRKVHEILDHLSMSNVELLTYYRSDIDLCRVMAHLDQYHAMMEKGVLYKCIQILKSIHVTKSGETLSQALLRWLEDLAEKPTSRDPKNAYRTLSAASALAVNLIPRAQYNEAMEVRLAKFLRVPDKRVVANVVEVLTHFKSGGDQEFFDQLLQHENNRIAANAIVHHGTQDLTPDLIKRLRKMLSSKSPAFVASALFAMGEIAAHHRSRDVVYFQAHVDFRKLVQMIPSFVKHAEPMVRRQAFIAARKVADEKTLDQVWKMVASDSGGTLLREAEEYLGPLLTAKDTKKIA